MSLPTAAPLAGRCLIAGEWLAPRGDFASSSPANSAEIIGHFPQATAEEAKQARGRRVNAFPLWQRTGRITGPSASTALPGSSTAIPMPWRS